MRHPLQGSHAQGGSRRKIQLRMQRTRIGARRRRRAPASTTSLQHQRQLLARCLVKNVERSDGGLPDSRHLFILRSLNLAGRESFLSYCGESGKVHIVEIKCRRFLVRKMRCMFQDVYEKYKPLAAPHCVRGKRRSAAQTLSCASAQLPRRYSIIISSWCTRLLYLVAKPFDSASREASRLARTSRSSIAFSFSAWASIIDQTLKLKILVLNLLLEMRHAGTQVL